MSHPGRVVWGVYLNIPMWCCMHVMHHVVHGTSVLSALCACSCAPIGPHCVLCTTLGMPCSAIVVILGYPGYHPSYPGTHPYLHYFTYMPVSSVWRLGYEHAQAGLCTGLEGVFGGTLGMVDVCSGCVWDMLYMCISLFRSMYVCYRGVWECAIWRYSTLWDTL